jgi:DNA-binding ferritin-like protein
MAASSSVLADFDMKICQEKDCLIAIRSSMAVVANTMRNHIDLIDTNGDKVSSNMIQDMVAGLDKWIWFISSHLE